MTQKPENPPAFPQSEFVHDPVSGTEVKFEGMTLRDYFAAAAMSAFLSNPELSDAWEPGRLPNHVSLAAYSVADGMLIARQS